MSTASGTFLVVAADEESAVLRAVTTGQVYTLARNPGVEPADIVDATLVADSPIEAVGTVDAFEAYPLEVEACTDPPGDAARAAVADQPVGTLERLERSWGELHAIAVPDAAAAVEDIRTDPETRARATRLGAHRVIVRGADGVVGVRYRTED
ncbi:MAG: DUF5812 family protein [Halobacteriaceae archaeon]